MDSPSTQADVRVNRISVLVDTDIGSNIDDALCLAYLLRQRRCELLGITTVTGQPTVRAQLVSAVCQVFGQKDITIHSGSNNPMTGPQQQTDIPQSEILNHWPHREHFEPNTAIDFLRETIRSRPGEITLLSIGPLTNIGRLFAIDPEIPRLLKQYICMAGVYFGPVPGYGLTERNTCNDPEATSIVFNAHISDMYCIGLDVTTQCRLPASLFRQRLDRSNLKIIADLAEVWFRNRSEVIFHDPLAAAVIFKPRLCTFQPGLVEIDPASKPDAPLTRFYPKADRQPHHVAATVNPKVFFEHYFATVTELPSCQVDFPPENP